MAVKFTMTAGLMLLACAAGAADLEINIEGIRSDKGQLMLAVYDNRSDYENIHQDQGYAFYSGRVHGGISTLTIHQLPPGRYAITLCHDDNGNRLMDTNIANMPIEGYGVSNARDRYDEPDFDRAAVTVGKLDRQVAIKMHYMSVAEDK